MLLKKLALGTPKNFKKHTHTHGSMKKTNVSSEVLGLLKILKMCPPEDTVLGPKMGPKMGPRAAQKRFQFWTSFWNNFGVAFGLILGVLWAARLAREESRGA